MFECSVAFAVPVGQVAAAVVYRPEVEIEIVVEFESTPCEICGTDCVDLGSDPNHCGSCDAVVGGGQVCQDGQPGCEGDGLTACADECVDLQTDRQNCGACGVTAPTCVDGEPGPEVCVGGETLCSGFCYPAEDCPVCCGGSCFSELDCACENDSCSDPTPGEWTPCFYATADTLNCEEACVFTNHGVCLNGGCDDIEAAGLLYQGSDFCEYLESWETLLDSCDAPIGVGDVTRCCCGAG